MTAKNGSKQYFCNPLNVEYHYQFNADPRDHGELKIGREAADPSMICFHNRYYIFASMNLSVWVSDDLVHWESHKLPENLPLYDYAPDARVIGEYVYLCASSREHKCNHYRTKDILNGPYEEIKGDFDFWDPNLFVDDDGRVYFFWGCTNTKPIWGVEKDPVTMKNITEPVGVIYGDPATKGYERIGEDNSKELASGEEVEEKYQAFVRTQMKGNSLATSEEGRTTQELSKADGIRQKPSKAGSIQQGLAKADGKKTDGTASTAEKEDSAKEQEEHLKKLSQVIRALFTNAPFIEGPWLTKHNGKYYLQYANPGAEYNVYNDGVYIADHPLGPYHLQKSNPFSYKPGGFLPGAGHGSTMEDRNGNWWHTATMRISKNFNFERRVGLWPAGFDKDGELFCNQRYGDWPMDVEETRQDPWREPEWFLLSYHAGMSASSYTQGKGPELAADENVQTWWQAATNKPGEWLQMDLGDAKEVHFIQINFADDDIKAAPAGPIHPGLQARWIDDRQHRTCWKLEGSEDGRTWVMLKNKTGNTVKDRSFASDAGTNPANSGTAFIENLANSCTAHVEGYFHNPGNTPADKGSSDLGSSDLPHDTILLEEGMKLRYLKLTVNELPFYQKAAVSGLRVFGIGNGSAPKAPRFHAVRTSNRDMIIDIRPQADAIGFNILWGESPDKLYHSWMILGKNRQRIGALVKGENYYVRIDAFNENGITHGTAARLEGTE